MIQDSDSITVQLIIFLPNIISSPSRNALNHYPVEKCIKECYKNILIAGEKQQNHADIVMV